MSKTFRSWEVDQVWLLPPSVHDFMPAGHPAHLVRELVRRELDLSAIFEPYEREERGQPPYHRAMLVALLLYAYTQGVYASRRIARGCAERLDIMAVTGMQRPDFRTISDFRKRHLAAWPSGSCRCCGCAGRRGWSSSATSRSTAPSLRPTRASTRQ
jgi:transposase